MEPAVLLAIVLPPLAGLLLAIPLFFCCCCKHKRQAPEETLPPPQVVVTLRTGDLDNYSLLSASFRPSTPTPAADNVTRKSLPFSRHPTRTPGLSASECGLGSSEATSTPQDITCFESGRSSALRLDSHPAASAVMTQGFGGSDSSRRRLSVTQHNCSGRQAANTPRAQLDDLQDLSSRPGDQSILGDGRRSSSTSTPGLRLSDLQDLSPRPRDRQSTVGRPSMVVPLHPQHRLAVFQV